MPESETMAGALCARLNEKGQKMLHIFDLDGTLIDSSHRKATRADGTLDLNHWRENATPEKVARDRLLPLAKHYLNIRQKGGHIVICTARVMGIADYSYLRAHGLHGWVLSREGEHDTRPDPILKRDLLHHVAARSYGGWHRFTRRAVMFDDSQPVIEGLRAQGLRVVDAARLNGFLSRGSL